MTTEEDLALTMSTIFKHYLTEISEIKIRKDKDYL